MRLHKKRFRTRYGYVGGKECDLYDLLINNCTDSTLNNGFEKYKPLYKNVFNRFQQRWTGRWHNRSKVVIIEKSMRFITKTFLDLMIRDLIFNNYEFIMPKDAFRLSIGYKTWSSRYNFNKFKFNRKTGGLTYVPRIVFPQERFEEINRTIYYIRLSNKYQSMLMEEIIKNNHEYLNSEPYDSY